MVNNGKNPIPIIIWYNPKLGLGIGQAASMGLRHGMS
jgi:hypothetical protein